MKQVSENIKAILSIIVVVMSIAYFYMCSIRDIKPDPQILIAMVGAMGTVLGYFFGASSRTNDVSKTNIGNADNVNLK